MYSIPTPQKLLAAAAVLATAPWTNPLMHLYTNDFTPDDTAVLGDFTEAAFTGYAPSSAITWGTPYVDPNGNAISAGSGKTFVMTDTVTPQVVYGYFVKTALGAYLFGGRFDAPLQFAAAGQGYDVVPTFQFSGN